MKNRQIVKLKDDLLEELNYLIKINKLYNSPQSLEPIVKYLSYIKVSNLDKKFNNLFFINYMSDDKIQLFPLDKDIPVIISYKNYFEIIDYATFRNVEEARAFYNMSNNNYYKAEVISEKEIKPKSNKIKLLEVNQFLNVNQNN